MSPGCDACYAAREAAGRLRHIPAYRGLATKEPGEPAVFTGEVRSLVERLDQPLRWRRPRRIFVNSMSDLFHPEVLKMMRGSMPFLAEVFAIMVQADWHQFQILTKRPQIMAAVLAEPRFRRDVNAILLRENHPVMPGGMTDPDFQWPAHLWFGTSIEADKYTFRADRLRDCRGAAVRFLSCEPLLGELESLDLTGIHWCIAGGESGPFARPTYPDWARHLRDLCVEKDVPFHWKQWGAWVPYEADPQPPFWDGPDGDMVDGHFFPADLSEGGPCRARTGGTTWWAPTHLEPDVVYRRALASDPAQRYLDETIHDGYPA